MIPTLDKIDHIHVYATNILQAEAWFQNVLGMRRVADRLFWYEEGGPLLIGNGQVQLSLFERSDPPPCTTIAFAVNANAFNAWRHHLNQVLPAPATLSDHRVSWSLYFSDDFANRFEITTYDYDAAARLLSDS